jgi:hypothetical protein
MKYSIPSIREIAWVMTNALLNFQVHNKECAWTVQCIKNRIWKRGMDILVDGECWDGESITQKTGRK